MKPTTLIIAAVGAIMLLPGCALRAPKTEVTADDFDLSPLVGQWSGEFDSESSGKVGDISFVLRAGEVSADGRIEMVAGEPENAIVPTDRPMVNGRVTTPARRLLTIHFVRKEGRRVIGLLYPYIDPACACKVTMAFEGAFTDGHTIEGTYSTIGSELAHIRTGGQWKMTRAKRL